MSHYIAYHNAEKRGFSFDIDGEEPGFVSNKGEVYLRSIVGRKIWVVSAKDKEDEGNKTVYRLVGYYVPENVVKSDEPDYAWCISGEKNKYKLSDKGVVLNDNPTFKKWFVEGKRYSHGNPNEITTTVLIRVFEDMLRQDKITRNGDK